MAEHHHRAAGYLDGGPFHDPDEIIDDGLPAPRPERSQLCVAGRGRPLPAVVGGDDVETDRGEGAGQVGVAQGVLAEAMGDDDHASRRLLGRPAVAGEPGTVGRLDGEGRRLHGRHCRTPVKGKPG